MNMQCDLGLLIHTLVFLDVEFVENGATGAPTSKPLRDAGMFNFYYVCHEKSPRKTVHSVCFNFSPLQT